MPGPDPGTGARARSSVARGLHTALRRRRATACRNGLVPARAAPSCRFARLWCRVRPHPAPRSIRQGRDLRGVPPVETARVPAIAPVGEAGHIQETRGLRKHEIGGMRDRKAGGLGRARAHGPARLNPLLAALRLKSVHLTKADPTLTWPIGLFMTPSGHCGYGAPPASLSSRT